MDYEDAPLAEQEKWDRFILDLIDHERKHEQHGAVALKLYEDELRKIYDRLLANNVSVTHKDLETAKKQAFARIDALFYQATDTANRWMDTMGNEFHCATHEGSCQVGWTDELERLMIKTVLGEKGLKELGRLKPDETRVPAQSRRK